MNIHSLEYELLKAGYRELFLYGDTSAINGIWQDGKHAIQLEELVFSDSISMHARFLALEVLRKHAVVFENDKDKHSTIVHIYCYALEQSSIEKENSFGLNANLWGLLYEEDDSGHLGDRLISFGNQAIPFLVKLLNDNGNVLYEGSEEAFIGNAYNYRIKDFAAFYLSKITDTPITFYQDIEERDREIERFSTLIHHD